MREWFAEFNFCPFYGCTCLCSSNSNNIFNNLMQRSINSGSSPILKISPTINTSPNSKTNSNQNVQTTQIKN